MVNLGKFVGNWIDRKQKCTHNSIKLWAMPKWHHIRAAPSKHIDEPSGRCVASCTCACWSWESSSSDRASHTQAEPSSARSEHQDTLIRYRADFLRGPWQNDKITMRTQQQGFSGLVVVCTYHDSAVTVVELRFSLHELVLVILDDFKHLRHHSLILLGWRSTQQQHHRIVLLWMTNYTTTSQLSTHWMTNYTATSQLDTHWMTNYTTTLVRYYTAAQQISNKHQAVEHKGTIYEDTLTQC